GVRHVDDVRPDAASWRPRETAFQNHAGRERCPQAVARVSRTDVGRVQARTKTGPDMNMQVPERGERLAKWSLAPWERQAVLGDLQEEFLNIAETAGTPAADRWYWRHVLLSLWPNLIRRARGDEHRARQIRQTAAIMV